MCRKGGNLPMGSSMYYNHHEERSFWDSLDDASATTTKRATYLPTTRPGPSSALASRPTRLVPSARPPQPRGRTSRPGSASRRRRAGSGLDLQQKKRMFGHARAGLPNRPNRSALCTTRRGVRAGVGLHRGCPHRRRSTGPRPGRVHCHSSHFPAASRHNLMPTTTKGDADRRCISASGASSKGRVRALRCPGSL